MSIIAKVNNVAIVFIDSEKLVPIKPICDALGVDMESQRKKINEDDILSSTAVLSTVVAADGKNREMTCLPIKFVFGWLFTINHKNVKPEAQEAVRKYKIECYDALYKHFTAYSDFLELRQKLMDEKISRLDELKAVFSNAKNKMAEAQHELNKVREMNFEDYQARQIELEFPAQSDNEENTDQ